MIVSVFFHGVVPLKLLRCLLFLVFDTLNDAILVKFKLALLVGALIFMMIHISLKDDSVPSITVSITTTRATSARAASIT